jgi:hypothetical protein
LSKGGIQGEFMRQLIDRWQGDQRLPMVQKIVIQIGFVKFFRVIFPAHRRRMGKLIQMMVQENQVEVLLLGRPLK